MRHIKVIDFGASKKIETTKTLTLSMNTGTVPYEPLEKSVSRKTGTQIEFKLKVDAWSLGIVILETLIAGNVGALREFRGYCPQNDANFTPAYFNNFMKNSFE